MNLPSSISFPNHSNTEVELSAIDASILAEIDLALNSPLSQNENGPHDKVLDTNDDSNTDLQQNINTCLENMNCISKEEACKLPKFVVNSNTEVKLSTTVTSRLPEIDLAFNVALSQNDHGPHNKILNTNDVFCLQSLNCISKEEACKIPKFLAIVEGQKQNAQLPSSPLGA